MILLHVLSDHQTRAIQTVDVNYPSNNIRNWLIDKADNQGQCFGGDDGNGGSNQSSELCVRISSKWYTVETQESLKVFWEDEADNFNDDSCDRNGIDDEGTIEMYHSDDNTFCIDVDGDQHVSWKKL